MFAFSNFPQEVIGELYDSASAFDHLLGVVRRKELCAKLKILLTLTFFRLV
jgi:hypothetical protein